MKKKLELLKLGEPRCFSMKTGKEFSIKTGKEIKSKGVKIKKRIWKQFGI